MSEPELSKLVLEQGEKVLFEEGQPSYWLNYNGKAVTVFYFKNCFTSKKIEIHNELEMKNMQIRGEPLGVTTFEFALMP